jgi:hypothetical protein
MNHAAEDRNIGMLDFDCPILVGKVGNGNELSQFLFHDWRTFGLILLIIKRLRLLSRLGLHITLMECD